MKTNKGKPRRVKSQKDGPTIEIVPLIFWRFSKDGSCEGYNAGELGVRITHYSRDGEVTVTEIDHLGRKIGSHKKFFNIYPIQQFRDISRVSYTINS